MIRLELAILLVVLAALSLVQTRLNARTIEVCLYAPGLACAQEELLDVIDHVMGLGHVLHAHRVVLIEMAVAESIPLEELVKLTRTHLFDSRGHALLTRLSQRRQSIVQPPVAGLELDVPRLVSLWNATERKWQALQQAPDHLGVLASVLADHDVMPGFPRASVRKPGSHEMCVIVARDCHASE